MSTKKIKEFNSAQFIKDIKSVRDILVWSSQSGIFLNTTKRDVLMNAERVTIKYYITDEIFVVKRNVMIII